ncbi:hypothetical protein OIU85_000086 [Salix viminalis]|nr:hypothetical protein OIU85_000086 [Salix viminalis]
MAQVAYQVVIFVKVQITGQVIFGTDQKLRKAMMFNSFVLLQVFNQFNSREIEKLNVFKNIHQNYWFRVATSGLLALQVASVEISGIIKGNARLDYEKWGICISFGIFSWVVDCMAKCFIKVQHRLLKINLFKLELHFAPLAYFLEYPNLSLAFSFNLVG